MKRDAAREMPEGSRKDLRRAVARAVLSRAAHIEAACWEAAGLGCGVSVVGDHLNYVAKADPRVPYGMVWTSPTGLGIRLAAEHVAVDEAA